MASSAARRRAWWVASMATCTALLAGVLHLDVLRVHADVPLLSPTITSISPTSGSSSGGDTVDIQGTNFAAGLPAPNVIFGGTTPSPQVTVVSNTEIRALTPAMCPGGTTLQVNTVAGTSNAVTFTFNALQPSVTGVTPATGSSDAATTVTISGANLYCPKTVAVGNVLATVVTTGVTNTPSSLTVSVPPQPGNTVGDVVVTPQTGPPSDTSAADRFTWRALPPVLSSISVTGGPSQGGTLVTLNGDHLNYATAVSFGASPGRVVSDADQQISVQSPAGCGAAPVSVLTAGGSSNTQTFQYTVTTPTVTSVNPASGPTTGGTTVTVSGSNLLCSTGASFGSAQASGVTVQSDTQITVSAPGVSQPGSVDVQVANAAGQSSPVSGDQYLFAAAPVIDSISPNAGPLGGGNTITVSGSNFMSGLSLLVGGQLAGSPTVLSPTTMTAIVPSRVGPGVVDVVAVTPGGRSSASPNTSYAYGTPTVTGLTPNTGQPGGGVSVVVHGSNFVPGSTVMFGNQPASSVAVQDANDLLVTTPPGTPGNSVDVVVTTAAGSSLTSTADRYAYGYTPLVTSISPDHGPTTGGATVSINGSAFTPSATVSFGGVPAASVTVNSATSITAVAPPFATPMPVDVTVTTQEGGASAQVQADLYTYHLPPTVTGVSPNAGPLSGGNTVTVSGTNFDPGSTTVTFGGIAATSVSVVSSTSLTATAPAGSAGTVDVVITTGGGATPTSLTDAYAYGAPTVTALSAAGGSSGGGAQIVVTGTGFVPGVQVRFGATAASSVTVSSFTSLTASAPAHVAGSVDVTVSNAAGTSPAGAADLYTFFDQPSVSGLVPAEGPVAGGTSVTVTGSGFAAGASVSFGSVAATGVAYSSPTSLTAVAPAVAAGTVDVRVTTPGGTSPVSAADQFTFDPVPAVSSLDVPGGPVAGGTTVTILGSGFRPSASVSFGGTAAASVSYVSASELVATSPAAVSRGSVDVTVTTPGGASATSAADVFQYDPVPAVSGLSVNAGPSAGGTRVTVTGSGFAVSGLVVSFGGVAGTAVSVASDTSLSATTPSRAPGSVDVTVQTPGGTSPTSSADLFSFDAVPTVSALSPTTGPLAGGRTVALTGSGFVAGSTSVSFGGTQSSDVTVSSSTQLTAVAPAAAAGAVPVVVQTPGGSSAPVTYTYEAVPSVGTLSPDAGPAAGGTSVTIIGTGFAADTTVWFGSTASSSVTVNSATSLTAVAPPGSAGQTVDVTVQTGGGTSAVVFADVYAYGAPTVTAVSPDAGPTAGGNTVTISGTGFVNGASVRFGTAAAGSVTVVSTTSISAVVPAGSAGVVDVVVANPAGSSPAVTADRYGYGTPAVTGIAPSGGPLGGGTTVVITGTGFVPGATVSFGSAAAASVSVDSATQITATSPVAPGGAAQGGYVTVTTPAGSSPSSAAALFSWDAVPAVSDLDVHSGPTAGGTVVTVTGTGFVAGSTTVSFGGIAGTAVSVVSSTSLQVTTPAEPAASIDVTVTTPGGTSAVSPGDVYTFLVKPTAASITPAAGPTAGGGMVTITGSGFAAGGTTVDFGAVQASNVSVLRGSSTLTATVPAEASGTVQVTVVTAGGASAPLSYSYDPVPSVSALSPDAGAIGGGTTVTVAGTGFTPDATVWFGSLQATSVTVDSASQITATSPAQSGAQTVDVTVRTPGGTSPLSFADIFAYGAPSVSSVSPDAGPLGGGGTVTITGGNFVLGASVSFGGVAASSVTVVSTTSISATVPGSARAGSVDVVVSTPAGSSPVGMQDEYAYGAPVVSGVSPNAGPSAGGNSVTITGSGFVPGVSVSFGNHASGSVTVVSSSQLVVVAPARGRQLSATVDVTVVDAAGTSATNPADQYTFDDPPVVTAVSPNAGPTAGGSTVTISGANFVPGSTVWFGDAQASAATMSSSTSITATSPAHAAGPVDVTVVTPGGTSATSAADVFSFDAVPSVTAVDPPGGPVGGGTTVTVTGSGFVAGSTTVSFGGMSATGVSVQSSSTLTATSPASATQQTVDVTVTTPGGTSSTSAGDRFSYGVPVVTGVTPNAGPVGGTNLVDVLGTDFTPLSTVFFGATQALGVVYTSSTDLKVAVPAGTAGVVDVTVTTAAGTSPVHQSDEYAYGVPTVTGVSPGMGPVAGGQTITVTGSGFVLGATVSFSQVAAQSVTVNSPTSITVVTPAKAAGTVDVLVANADGTSSPTLADQYVFLNVPQVTSTSPTAGPVAGGQTVTVNGVNFTGPVSVKFGSNPATNVHVISSTALTATSPAGSSGAVDVTVTTYGGTSPIVQGPPGDTDRYTYGAPSITAISPNGGGAGATVTITGSNFSYTGSLSFGGVAATVLNISETAITARAPAVSGQCVVDVDWTTAAGTSTHTLADNYAYCAPSISSVTPNAGPLQTAEQVTITGSGFVLGATVSVNGSNETSVTVNGPTSITAWLNPLVAGTYDVVVGTSAGSSALTQSDWYASGAPVVTGLSVPAGPTGGGTVVAISGQSFVPGATVSVGGVAPATTTVVSKTEIDITTPVHSTGAADIVVTSPAGSSTTSSRDQFTFDAPPAVTGVSPNAGPTAGNTTVTVTGTNFVAGSTTVAFGATAGTSVQVTSTTTLTVVSPAESMATVDVTVTTPGGTTPTSSADRYSFDAPPAVTGVAPNAGTVAGGTTVTVSGTNFVAGVTTVRFGGLAASGVTVNSATSLTAVSPAQSSQVVNVVVTTPGGSTPLSSADYFAYGPPSVTAVTPDAGVAAGGGTVTVTGSNFVPGVAVKFGGATASSTFVSTTSLSVTVPAGTAGSTVDVVVTSGAGSSATGIADLYAYGGATVASVSPIAGPTGGGAVVTVTGTGFVPGATVKFGSVAGTGVQVTSSTALTVTSPAEAAGVVDVTVTNPAGTSAVVTADRFAFGAPTVTSVNPTAGPTAGGTTLTVLGSDFVQGVTVSFGVLAGSGVQVLNATHLTVVTPAAAAGTVDVVVRSPAGSSATGAADQYSFDAPPTVTGVSPVAGPTAGGTTITVSGTNFVAGGTSVAFGGVAGSNVQVTSATSLTVVAPAHASSPVDVTVVTPGGVSATGAADVYTFDAPPTVSALAPNAGSTAGGTSVTITGTNFVAGSTVMFGGVAASSVTVNSATSITAVSPAQGAQVVNVQVTTPGGSTPLSSADYFAYGAPSVTSLNPDAGAPAGGNTVTVNGGGFVPGVTVKFGATAATTTYVSTTSLSATVPAGTAGSTVDVVVTSSAGSSATGASDLYAYGAPAVTVLSPNGGPTAGNTLVTITGTGFVPGATVSFGGSAGTGVVVNSATSISVVAPAEPGGVVNVTVTTPAGTSTTSASTQYAYGAPTVTAVSPRGSAGAGVTVTVTGTGFVPGATVNFGAYSGTNVVVASTTSLTVTSPSGPSGVVDVVVTTPGGSSATSQADQYAASPPAVKAVSPNAGPTAGGTSVTITGTNFVLGSTVAFGVNNATSVSVQSTTTIVATAPAGAAGVVDVTVSTAAGTSTPAQQDQYAYGAPVVSGVNPSAGPVAGGTTITISGSGFVLGATVRLGAVAATGVVVNSATSITAVTPAAGISTVDVVVTTPAGSSATSSADQYTYDGIPTVTGVSPVAGYSGGGTTVTITGTNLVSGATVAFGSVAGTGVSTGSCTTNTCTSLTVTSPAQAAGTITVVVTTPGGSSSGVQNSSNSYTYEDQPSVTSVSLNAGVLAGGNTVTIGGTNFVSGATVKFGTAAATNVGASNCATAITCTTITATVPASASAQTVDVTVTTPGGTSSTGTNDLYAYGVPTVTSLSPASGPLNTQVTVVIHGSNFVGGPNSSVLIGSQTPVSTTWSPPNMVTVVTRPQTNAGYVDMLVSNAAGQSTAVVKDVFAFGAPTVTDVEPPSGSTTAATTLTITGSNFSQDDVVKFGTAPASVTVVSATQITATIAAGQPAGAVDVTVSNSVGTSPVVANDTFVFGPPSISNLSPSVGGVNGGTVVTVNGSGFARNLTLTFNGAATGYTYNSTSQISFTTPGRRQTGGVGVAISTGQGSSSATYTYQQGFWIVNNAGQTWTEGSAPSLGLHGGGGFALDSGTTIIAGAARPQGDGYWLLGSDGNIYAFGNALNMGSELGATLNQPVKGIAATPSGNGYMIVAGDGGTFTFGDARGFGNPVSQGLHLNKPAFTIQYTPDGGGYWIAAQDGGVFTYGNAPGFGSEGNCGAACNPFDGFAAMSTGQGYWLVQNNGKINAFGQAGNFGWQTTCTCVTAFGPSPDDGGYVTLMSGGNYVPWGDAQGFSNPVTSNALVIMELQ